MDNDTLEHARNYTDYAFELAEEECQALRTEIEMLRERIEALEVEWKGTITEEKGETP